MAIESAMCDTHNVIVIVVFSRDIFQCMCDFINSHDINLIQMGRVCGGGRWGRPAGNSIDGSTGSVGCFALLVHMHGAVMHRCDTLNVICFLITHGNLLLSDDFRQCHVGLSNVI